MAGLGAALPRMLAARGFDTVFGIPGVHNVEMYRGLPGSGLRHVTPRHEQGAGFMADGFARASGRPAVCFVITGPGLGNIATAMGQALADSVPMLVLTPVTERAHLGKGLGRLHELSDQAALGGAVARWSATAAAPEDLPRLLDHAVATFRTARPGPVHIEVPLDLLRAAAPADAPAPPPAPPAPDEAAVAEAARILRAAARPALVLGGGALGLGQAHATDLAERLGAVTLLTSNARGLLAHGHPLLAGGGLPFAPVRRILEDSDATLAIGTEFGTTDWHYYDESEIRCGRPLIRVDVDPDQLQRNVAPDLAVTSDAAAFVAALLPLLGTARRPARIVRDVRAASAACLAPRVARHLALLDTIRETLPDVPLVGDSTEPAYCGLVLAGAAAPRRWWCSATGFGTLGYALPAASGASLASGGPAIALMGDGGALYSIAELASAVEARLPVILLVWNNGGFGEIRHAMVEAQVRPEGVDLSPVDFAALARGFGAAHAEARDRAALAALLPPAAARPGPTLIELRAAEWRF